MTDKLYHMQANRTHVLFFSSIAVNEHSIHVHLPGEKV